MRILSIQSSVAFGHVGNSAAVFPLQRLGHSVIAVDTVQFSNHTGYSAFRGRAFPPEAVADVLRGVTELGVLASVDAVLTGYLGSASMGAVVLDAVAAVRSANPEAIWCCDPVMGDSGRLFVAEGVPAFFQSALATADVLTPNVFELELLSGQPVVTLDDVLEAADALRARGPRVVLVTSVPSADGLDTVVLADEGAWAVSSPLLDLTPAGAGDLTAALFLAHLPAGPRDALVRAISSVYAVLVATPPGEELAIVDAQQAIATPPEDLVNLRQLR